MAILQALREVRKKEPQQMVILTDSKPSLQISENQDKDQATASKITEFVAELSKPGFQIAFQWIPIHVGLRRNEEADA